MQILKALYKDVTADLAIAWASKISNSQPTF
jgi:hypothetical protein